MKKFVIERNFPGAANLTAQELQAISQKSCEVAQQMGKPYTWVQSYVAGDKIYCVHIAENEDVVREHSTIAKFPVHTISEVKTIIDPTTSTPLKAS